MEVYNNLKDNQNNEFYVDLFRKCLQNISGEESREDEEFYNGFENKINKIYFVRRSEARHTYTTSTGRVLGFKAQRYKLEGDFRKRTVDPQPKDAHPFHYWEFNINDMYLIHYTIRPEYQNQIAIPASIQQPENNNNGYINDGFNDDAEYLNDDHASPNEDIQTNATTDVNMQEAEGTEPAEDYFIYQPWASYNPFDETLTLNCNLAFARNYQVFHPHADYAEWLLRNDPSEIIQPGDVVGIISSEKGITKTINPSYVAGVISSQHAICANLPGPDIRPLGEPVAFKGQVPIKVIGEVKPNDIIVPSGRNDGTGIAKRLCKTPELMNHVVGHAWEGSKDVGIKLVNCLIDIKSPDASYKADSVNISARGFELQELIMHNLAELDHYNTFIDLHLVNQTAILAELKDLVRRLLNLSGLTIIVWVDKSAVHGFIKNQFLSEFGEPDILSGAVLLEEKESLIFVEEWSRDVSNPTILRWTLTKVSNLLKA